MRPSRPLLGVVLACAFLGTAHADDERPGVAEPAFARKVADLLRSGDSAAAGRMVDESGADPWFAADLIVGLGEADTARRLRHADGTVVARLDAYLKTEAGADPQKEARRTFYEAQDLIDAGDFGKGAALLEGLRVRPGSVLSVRRSMAIGDARLRRAPPDPAASGREFRASAATAEKIGWTGAAVDLEDSAGRAFQQAGRPVDALAAWSSAVRLVRGPPPEAGDLAVLLNNAGSAAAAAGLLDDAAIRYRESVDAYRASGRTLEIAGPIANLVVVETQLGRWAKALTLAEDELAKLSQERVRIAGEGDGEALRACDRRIGELEVWLGATYLEIEREADAGPILERAIARLRTAGADPEIQFVALGDLGLALLGAGRTAEAEKAYRDALRGFETLGSDRHVTQTLSNLSILLARKGDETSALKLAREAVDRAQKSGQRAPLVLARGGLAWVHATAGRLRDAEAEYRAALGDGEALGETSFALGLRMGLAGVLLDLDDPVHALAEARAGLESSGRVVGGLGESEGVLARAPLTELFGVGIRAARIRGDAKSLLVFAEAERGGRLAEAMGGRERLWSVALPPDLAEAEHAARRRESEAREAISPEGKTLTRDEKEVRREAHWAVWQELLTVIDRIHREAASAGDLIYPRPMEASEVAALLRPDEVLVVYVVDSSSKTGAKSQMPEPPGELLGVVVHRGTVRFERLGPWQEHAKRISETLKSIASGKEGTALDDLAATLAVPLRVPDTASVVLVSPTATIANLPVGRLFPSHETSFVPSAAVLRLLRAGNEKSGEGTLAVGAPADSETDGSPAVREMRKRFAFSALPGARREAETASPDALLGAAATEKAVRDRLASHGRWRTILFACHGGLDENRPLLSFLALTPQGDDDGLLTANEILRMRMPADLVVLSACRSALGSEFPGEGQVGLVRSLFHAGATRVLSSLWDVDDAATSELMIRFLKRWNAGTPPAKALSEAQAEIRDGANPATGRSWRAAKYWAGWVVWGPAR